MEPSDAAPSPGHREHALADLLGEGDDGLDVAVLLEGQADHVVELEVLDAVLEDPGGLVEDLGVRELLVQDLAHAVAAALGGEGEALDAGVGQLEDELGGEVVEAKRGHGDLVVEAREVVHDGVDLRVVAHRGGDEADLARDLPHLAGAVHDLLAREAAHRAGSCSPPSRTGTCRGSPARSPP